MAILYKEFKEIISLMSLSLWLTIIVNLTFPVIIIFDELYLVIISLMFGTYCLIFSSILLISKIDTNDLLSSLIFIFPIVNIYLWVAVISKSEEIKFYFYQWKIFNPYYFLVKTKYIYKPIRELEYYKDFNIFSIDKNHFMIQIKTKSDWALYLLMNAGN